MGLSSRHRASYHSSVRQRSAAYREPVFCQSLVPHPTSATPRQKDFSCWRSASLPGSPRFGVLPRLERNRGCRSNLHRNRWRCLSTIEVSSAVDYPVVVQRPSKSSMEYIRTRGVPSTLLPTRLRTKPVPYWRQPKRHPRTRFHTMASPFDRERSAAVSRGTRNGASRE